MVDKPTTLTDHVVAYPPGAPVQAAVFLDDVPTMACEDGSVVQGPPDDPRTIAAHADGAVLCAATTGKGLYTGGDDGLVVIIRGDGTTQTLHDAKGKWIDALTVRRPSCSTGRARTSP